MSGESTPKIGQRFGTSHVTISRWLRYSGVTLRGPKETSTKCQLRHDSFDELTSDASYWIGFMFADGSVTSSGQSGRVSVRVSERDRNHLVKLRSFLGSIH